MAFNPESLKDQSSKLEEEQTGLAKNPEESNEVEEAEQSPEDIEEEGKNKESIIPPEQVGDQVYEFYYQDASLDNLKQGIEYLNSVRQNHKETDLLRFITGRSERKPNGSGSQVIWQRPDLSRKFAIGSSTDPENNASYTSEKPAAHDLIEYLVAELESAVKKKEAAENDEHDKEGTEEPEKKGPGAKRGDLPTDTAGEVPEAVKEGRGSSKDKTSSDQYDPGKKRADLPTDTAENPGDVPEQVKEGKRGREDQEDVGPEDTEDKADEPDQETEGENQEEEVVDPIPNIELEEGPGHPLREARKQYLKGQRLRNKTLRGKYTSRVMEWLGSDRRSVKVEKDDGTTEELFFGKKDGEANIQKLQERYYDALETYRDEKMAEFVRKLDDDLSDEEKQQAMTEFAVDLKTTEMEQEEKAFDQVDESFDDSSFRDWWRKDSTWWKRMGGSAGAITVTALSGGVAGAAAAGGRGLLAGTGAAVATEGALERVHAEGKNKLSRTGLVSDVRLNILDNVDDEIEKTINKGTFKKMYEYAKTKTGMGESDRLNKEQMRSFKKQVSQAVNQLSDKEVNEEMGRVRMLANDLGTSLDQAIAGSGPVTAEVVRQMQDRENQMIGNSSLSATREQIDTGEMPKSEAVQEELMNKLMGQQEAIHEQMMKENDAERSKKIKRRWLAAVAGGTVGTLIGSKGIDKLTDWFGYGEGATDTPPVDGGQAPDMPPISGDEQDPMYSVDITDWDGPTTYNDASEARSFIEATGDIKEQMQNVDAFDTVGGSGTPLENLEAAENLQDFLDDDIANDLAERLDGYRPEDVKESLVVDPGETMAVTKEGNLILEHADGEVDTLYNGAEDTINDQAFKDNLFGDFDDTSGIDDFKSPEGATSVESADPTDLPAESLEKQLEKTPGDVNQEVPNPPNEKMADVSGSEGSPTNAGVEGTDNQAGTMEDTPEMTDHDINESGQERSAEADAGSAAEGADQSEGQQTTTAESNQQAAGEEIAVDTGEDAMGAEAGPEANVSGEVVADPTSEDISQLLSENTELNFYPQRLASNIAVSDPPGLTVSEENVHSLVDFLSNNDDKELVSMIDYLADPDSEASPQHLATLSELFDYHLENPDAFNMKTDIIENHGNHVKTMDNYVEKMLRQAMDQAESDRVWEEIDNAQDVYDDLNY
jgi:hypothetical protein